MHLNHFNLKKIILFTYLKINYYRKLKNKLDMQVASRIL